MARHPRIAPNSATVTAMAIGWALTAATAAAPAGSRIAFEGDRFGGWGLAAMAPDGSGLVNLNAPPGAADASWSPNGQQVAFEADPLGDGNLEIFIMNADGSNVRQLTDSPERDYWPDWFPSGRQLAFTSERTGVPNVYVMNVDGTDQRALTSDALFGNLEPDVSPDGRQVVFMRSAQFDPPTIWKLDVHDLVLTPLTLPGPHADLDPQWSPDGKRIVFASDRTGSFEIWTMDGDGGNPVQLTAAAGRDFNPTFSPNGRQIAWWKLRSGQGDIWVMNSDGSAQTNITSTPGVVEGFPDWHQGHLRGQ